MRSMRLLVPTLLCTLLALGACGKKDKAKGSGGGGNAEPAAAQPDPAELERQRQAEEEKQRQQAEALQAEQRKLKAQLADLESELKSMQAKHAAEAEALPDKVKLRRVLSQLVRDAGEANSIYETDKKRLEAVQKEVAAQATDEIREVEKKIAEKEKEYAALLSGRKEERVNADLGIAEETEVQKQLRTLRAAKSKWFELTREVRRGAGAAAGAARTAYRSWLDEDAARKGVVSQAIPDGKTPESYDFGQLEFYLFLELLEDDLERKNVVAEKKTLSETDQKLIVIEGELDALTEGLATMLSEGGGALEQYTSIKERIDSERERAEGLTRQLEEMRATYAEVDATVERHKEAEYEIEKKIEAAKQRLAEINRQLR